MKPTTPDLPVVRTRADAEEHPPTVPALLVVPGTLIGPLFFVLERRHEQNPRGAFCRAIEELIKAIYFDEQARTDAAMEGVIGGWLTAKRTRGVWPMEW